MIIVARRNRGKRISGVAALRAALTAWLIRPMTSFHLVLAVFGLLTVLGLAMVLSASSVESYDVDQSSYAVFKKQLIYVGVGLPVFWLALRISPRTLRRISPPLLLLCVLLLVVVLTPAGTLRNGARSWFVVGPLSFQPVEAAKVALGLWGAHVLVTKRALLQQYRHLLVPLVPVALVMFGLVMLQPDLGSVITMGTLLMALLWFAGAPLRLFGVLAAGGISGVLALAMAAQYRLDRVKTFLNPDADPDKAYQANQALLALAEGGVFGKGLGQGSSKWDYLPNVHNDFIFAVIGEELGFIGCGVVLGLFATLAYTGLRIAARNTDPWARLVAASFTVWLVSQAGINMCYVVGLLPVTGLPLPLISSGGTSVVVTMLVFGILANFARHEPEAIATLRAQGQGKISRFLRLPLPEPYRPPVKRRPVRPSTPPRGAGRPTASAGRAASGRSSAGQQLEDRWKARRGATQTDPRRGSWRGIPDRSNSGRGARGRTTEGGHR